MIVAAGGHSRATVPPAPETSPHRRPRMNNRFVTFIVDNAHFSALVAFIAVFFGLTSLSQINVAQDPDIDYPVVLLKLFLAGAPPERMERNVIYPVEAELPDYGIYELGGMKGAGKEAGQDRRVDLDGGDVGRTKGSRDPSQKHYPGEGHDYEEDLSAHKLGVLVLQLGIFDCGFR